MVFVKIGNRLERLLGTQEAHDNQSNDGPWVSCIATIGGSCWWRFAVLGGTWIEQLFLSFSLLCWGCNKRELVKVKKKKTQHTFVLFLSFIFLDLPLSLSHNKVLAAATTYKESCVEKASLVVIDGLLIHVWKERKIVCDDWRLVEFVVVVGGDGNWCINCRWVRGCHDSFLLSWWCLSLDGKVVMVAEMRVISLSREGICCRRWFD